MLDKHLIDKATRESKEQRKYMPLRPSAAGKCAAELATEYAEYKGLKETNQEIISPELARIFSLGHSVEYHILRMFEEAGFLQVRYRQQTVRFLKLPEGKWLEGSIDMTFFMNGEGGIGDVKSKKDRHSSFGASGWHEAWEGYSKMKSTEVISDSLIWINDLPSFLEELKDPWIKPNFIQLNIYANTDFVKQSNINHAFVLQYNKNTSELRELRFRPSEEIYEQTKAKFLEVHNKVTASTTDTIDSTLRELRCSPGSLCRYCWPDAAKRAYFETLPPKKWPKDTNRLGQEGQKLEELFAGYEELTAHQEHAGSIEQAILKIMVDKDETKVRLSNGNVYEAKFLKSPRPHHELRRSK
jgi:hypothetical protein